MDPLHARDQDESLAGVVLFNDRRTLNSAWCSIEGEAARKIAGARELSTAAVWLTNLDFNEFGNSGLHGSHRYRRENYLRSRLNSISTEIGTAQHSAGGDSQDVAHCAVRLSDLFSRVMKVSHRLGVPGFPPHQLRQGFHSTFWLPIRQPIPPEIEAAVRDSTELASLSERQQRPKAIGKTPMIDYAVNFHRVEHARQMISMPLPSGRWRRLPMMSIPQIVSHELPLLIRAEVMASDAAAGSILNFGGNALKSRMATSGRASADAQPRGWMTLPEFIFLSRHAKLAVNEIYEAERYMSNPLRPVIQNFGDCQSLSISFQLAAESLWTCPLVDASNRMAITPQSAWLSAYDRMRCAEIAIEVAARDADVDILSYGYGRLCFRGPEYGDDRLRWMAMLLRGTDLIPPMPSKGGIETSEDGENLTHLYRAMILSGDHELLADADSAALAEWDDRFPAGYSLDVSAAV